MPKVSVKQLGRIGGPRRTARWFFRGSVESQAWVFRGSVENQLSSKLDELAVLEGLPGSFSRKC